MPVLSDFCRRHHLSWLFTSVSLQQSSGSCQTARKTAGMIILLPHHILSIDVCLSLAVYAAVSIFNHVQSFVYCLPGPLLPLYLMITTLSTTVFLSALSIEYYVHNLLIFFFAYLGSGWLGGFRVQLPASAPPGNNSGQVVNTHVPLSPSSTICYRPKGGDALQPGR